MKVQVFMWLLVALFVAARAGEAKDEDESRPYEFGFKVDGQQHRHESKDINGIIEGEFGFITADGIYHVTVYATDENGFFRILSMKNVRVSPPLDQLNATLPSSIPETAKRAQQPAPTLAPTLAPASSSSAARVPYAFTTVPSLTIPSCSGCALPSTVRPPNGHDKLPFQTPAFQNPKRQTSQKDYPGSAPVKPQTLVVNTLNRGGQTGAGVAERPRKGDAEKRTKDTHREQEGVVSNSVSSEPFSRPNPLITIHNGAITVPGNEPIPIKNKYPDMVEGLPRGITRNDMLDLLYRFNYTLGFHGHHEKGLKNGTKIGGYFVNGRDGISRIVEYIADENGYRPKVKFINLGLASDDTPKPATEKTFRLKGFEFVWYPVT